MKRLGSNQLPSGTVQGIHSEIQDCMQLVTCCQQTTILRGVLDMFAI